MFNITNLHKIAFIQQLTQLFTILQNFTNKCDLKTRKNIKKYIKHACRELFLLSCSATVSTIQTFQQFHNCHNSERKLNAELYKTHQTHKTLADKLTIEWITLNIVYYAPIYCFILDFACCCR